METRILKTTGETLVSDLIVVREILEKGGLVAFPTETVYGLGGNAFDPEASRKIYAAKGRPSDNPLIVHIGDESALFDLVKEIPAKARLLMDAFWPGPLTIILNKNGRVPDETTGGLSTVAVRMPSHPFANAMLKALPFPVAAPSANRSGRPSTTKASHVIEDLTGRVDLIIDGGDVPIGVESTIVDCTEQIPVLLRPGFITLSDLEAVVGTVRTDPAIKRENLINHTVGIEKPRAPGMKYRHYAPKAKLLILNGSAENVSSAINSRIAALLRDGAEKQMPGVEASGEKQDGPEKPPVKIGVLSCDENRSLYDERAVVLSAGSRKDAESIAHNLFSVLRQFDDSEVDLIFSEDFTEIDIGTAIMNRLLKAAGGAIKEAKEIQNDSDWM